jgi:hypothetical protein
MLQQDGSQGADGDIAYVHAKEKEKEKDPDPDGEQLAKTEDPLGEATKLVQRLREHSGDCLRTHELSFEVCHPFSVYPVKPGVQGDPPVSIWT